MTHYTLTGPTTSVAGAPFTVKVTALNIRNVGALRRHPFVAALLLVALSLPLVGLVSLVPTGPEPLNGHALIHQDRERAAKLGRELAVYEPKGDPGPEVVRLAHEGQFDLIILCLPHEQAGGAPALHDPRAAYVLSHAHCRVFLAASPVIPQEVVDKGL